MILHSATHKKNLILIFQLCNFNVCDSNCIHSNVNSHHHQSSARFSTVYCFCKHRPNWNEIFFQQSFAYTIISNNNRIIWCVAWKDFSIFSWSSIFFLCFSVAFIVICNENVFITIIFRWHINLHKKRQTESSNAIHSLHTMWSVWQLATAKCTLAIFISNFVLRKICNSNLCCSRSGFRVDGFSSFRICSETINGDS